MSIDWRPIAEAPKDGTRVLVYRKHGYDRPYEVAAWSMLRREWIACDEEGRYVYRDPTHFAQLTPPTE